MSPIEKLKALAAGLDHLPRSRMTAGEVAEFNEGRQLAEALAAAAREPGAPSMMVFGAWSQLSGRSAAIVGFAFRRQQLLAEAKP